LEKTHFFDERINFFDERIKIGDERIFSLLLNASKHIFFSLSVFFTLSLFLMKIFHIFEAKKFCYAKQV